MAATIFERCGGFSTVRKIVSSFYDKVLDSPTLQGFFADTDMRRLIDHQTKFIAFAMGGPASFDDETLRRTHAALDIAKRDFDEVAELLRESLEEHGLSAADVDAVVRAVVRREAMIVARPR